MKRWILSAALFVVSYPLLAQGAPEQPCQEPTYREFDFWVGEWEVFDSQGERVGESSITIEERGCLLVEHWRSATGGRGQSYNFFDHTSGQWREIFVSNWGTKDYRGGLDEKGRMVLAGTIGYADGYRAPFRGMWTPNDDGTVTQYLEEYNADARQWEDWFTGTYRRKTESP